jgi:DNA polymerase-3 subunit alpha
LIKQNSVFTATNPTHSLSFYLKDEYNRAIVEHITNLKQIFKDDLYVGIQRCNQGTIPIDKIAADIFEYNAGCVGVKTVALNNTFIHKEGEIEELQILLCSREKSKFASIKDNIQTDEKAHLYRFFNDKNFALYGKDYYSRIYNQSQIDATQEISDKIENFTLLANPKAPNFVCPDGLSQKDYLLNLCRAGWQRILPRIDQNRTQEYVDRIKHELDVVNRANIEGYFLVVQDYVNWAKNQGMLVGCGRGSAAGCLTSYLVNITSIDPIVYGLMFERFYNEGRNSPGKTSFPDIDVDFPVFGRERVIEYIRQKYGRDQVSQIFTLQEIQGRSAIREVLRVYGACPQEFINEISKKIPQKAAIADKLEESKETSIIRWTLENEPDILKDWCELKDDEVIGEYAFYFNKAIEIEGTFKGYGKHASAVVIANEPIAGVCPMVKDKSSDEFIAAIEYEDLERMGLMKVDILGCITLDKLSAVNDLLQFGEIRGIVSQENGESISEE